MNLVCIITRYFSVRSSQQLTYNRYAIARGMVCSTVINLPMVFNDNVNRIFFGFSSLLWVLTHDFCRTLFGFMLFFKELHVRRQSYSVKKKREIGYAGEK